MTWRLRKTVVMVGMMGAGKTAVGQQLSRILGVPFLDSDEEISRAANMTIPEIFARDGEAFFRQKEAQVIARLLAGRACVLSTGGGAFLREENRAAIQARGISVWLKADLELLWLRVRHRGNRPLLRTADPKRTLAELSAARTPVYAQAEITVQSYPEMSVEQTAAQVTRALELRPDVLERT